MPNSKLRVGIISANWGAQSHLPSWRTLDDVEVVAMCTSRQETAEAAAARYRIPRPFWDYEAMCRDPDIDIIDVGTNPLQREKMVAAALASGKHVINQLPFASSAEAAEQLVAQQRKQGVVGAAATSIVGLPHVGFLKEIIDSGEAGEILQVQCSWQMSYFIPPIPDFPYNWFGKAGLGVSVTRNQGSHLLHLMRHLFGPIEAVVGRMESRLEGWETKPGEWMRNETDDTLQAMVRFVDGPMATVCTSWVAVDSPGFQLEIFGKKQRLRLAATRYPGVVSSRLYRASANPYMEPHGEEIAVPERFMKAGDVLLDPSMAEDPSAGPQLPSTARLFHSFVDAIRHGGEPMASFSRALEVQRAVAALYQSHEAAAWVKVEQQA